MTLLDTIREAFERISGPNFGIGCGKEAYFKKPSGEYFNPILEDHWQTFQEGWGASMNKNSHD